MKAHQDIKLEAIENDAMVKGETNLWRNKEEGEGK